MRTKKSLINMTAGVGSQMLTLILSLVGRMIFVRYLSSAHLGVNGLFSDIIGVMSLAELGLGSALVYSMYRPAAQEDRDTVVRLMNFYKQLYRWVALAVFALGMALYPFLDYFTKGSEGVEHLHFIYLLYLANAVGSYLFSYKSAILMVNQRDYISTLYSTVSKVAQLILQILVLVFTENFVLYLAVQLICTFLANVAVAKKADKDYPYLNMHKELPSKEVRRGITKNIVALSMHKFGTVMVLRTDSLIMSAFVGLSSVGIYSNYKIVTSNATTLLSKVCSAFTGSVGNLNASESPEKIYEIYQALDFMLFLAYGYVSAGIFVLSNPFVELCFGKEYLFSMITVLVIAIDFYTKGMRQINLIFKDTMGVFWQDRYKPVIEALINLVVSIALVFKYQVTGVIIGTIVSCMLTNFWVDPYVMFRYGIKEDWQKKLKKYFLDYLCRVLVLTAGTAVAWLACRSIPYSNLLWLIAKGIVCTVAYNIVVLIAFGRSWQFRYLRERAVRVIKKKTANISNQKN